MTQPLSLSPKAAEDSPTEAARRLGFWAAVATAALAIAWEIAMVVQTVLAPPSAWDGATRFVARFRPVEMLNLVPALGLAPAFLVLMVCVHFTAPPSRRVWSAVGVALATVYAVMASVNYLIQLAAVRTSALAGESEGLALFAMSRPHSIFWALASAYAYQALALLFTAPVFRATAGVVSTRRAAWIRRVFLGVGVTTPLQLGWAVVDLPAIVAGAVMLLWVVGIPAAAILLAREFRGPAAVLRSDPHD